MMSHEEDDSGGWGLGLAGNSYTRLPPNPVELDTDKTLCISLLKSKSTVCCFVHSLVVGVRRKENCQCGVVQMSAVFPSNSYLNFM